MAIDPLLRIVFLLFVLFGCVRSDLPEVAPVSDGVAVPPPTPTASFEQSAAPSSTISPPAVVSSNPLEISFYGNGTATTLNDAVLITSVQFQGRVVGDSGPCNAPLFAPRAQGPFTDAQTPPSAPGVHPAPSTVATATPMYSAPPLDIPVTKTRTGIFADVLLPWRWTPFQAIAAVSYSASGLHIPVTKTRTGIFADVLLPWHWTPFQATVAIAHCAPTPSPSSQFRPRPPPEPPPTVHSFTCLPICSPGISHPLPGPHVYSTTATTLWLELTLPLMQLLATPSPPPIPLPCTNLPIPLPVISLTTSTPSSTMDVFINTTIAISLPVTSSTTPHPATDILTINTFAAFEALIRSNLVQGPLLRIIASSDEQSYTESSLDPSVMPFPPSPSNASLPPTTHNVEEGPISTYVDNVSGGIRYPPGAPHPLPGSIEYNDVATHLWRDHTKPLMLLSAQCGFRFSPNSTYTTTAIGNNLGVSFTNGSELRISDLRLQGLRDFARPAKITLSDVHSIRGLFNSFSRFCNTIEFSQLVSLFTDIITTCTTTKCPAASLWTRTHDDAFDRLKVLILDSTVLYVPDPSLPYYVRCDASAPSDISNSGSWCGMLFQYNRAGIVCPISVVSKSFTPAQASYHTKDKELAGIVLFLRVLQKYHLPSSNLVVHTDHANIAYLNSSSDHRTRTWCAELQLRNIFFQHLPGSEMRPNDALSRLPIVPPAPAPSLEPPPLPTPSVTSTISAFFSAPPTFITTTIAASKVLIKANLTQYLPLQQLFSPDELSYMESRPESFFRATIPVVAIPGATTDGQLWLHTNAVVIPSTCSDLISQTLRDAHRLGCHPREKEMTSLLTHVWWPTKSKDITAYIASCPQCQVIDAPPRSSPHGYFNINNPSAPNHTHILDHLEMSPASADGHVAILTVTCAFTRFCHLIPVKSHSAADTLDAAMTAWHATGLPVRVQTDGSTSFTADFSNYLSMFRIDHHITDAYAPWQNGKSERQHAPITTKLRKVTLGLDQTLWHLALPLIAGVLNSTTNRATGATPYFLMHAHEKRTPAVALTDLSTSTGTIAEWHAAIKQVQDVLTLKNDITSLQQAHVRAERPDVPFTFTLHQDVLLFFPTRPEKLSSFWRPGYRVTDLLPDDDTHVIISRVEPDGLLYDPQRVPVARLRPFDSSRAPHSGALMRITDGSLAVDAIVSHTRVHEPPTPPMYTFTVSWKDPSVPHATARLQDLMLNCDPILRQYCAVHKIPYSHLAAQRAHLNKQAKSLAVQPLPAARATLAAIFGPFPVHPSEPTYRWL